MFKTLGVVMFLDVALSMAPLVDNLTQVPDLSALFEKEKKQFENSTSCEELLYNYTFDPLSVLNEDWKRFYFWNSNDKPLHMFRFSVPYPVLIDRFRSDLNLTPPVEWSKAALFMETTEDLSALFISTNVSGKFRVITNLDFHYDIPYTEMALKVVKPFYLILLHCDYRFGYGLAPFDKVPDEDHINDAVAQLGIRSKFNETYLFEEQIQSQISTLEEAKNDDDDDDDDRQQYIDDEEL